MTSVSLRVFDLFSASNGGHAFGKDDLYILSFRFFFHKFKNFHSNLYNFLIKTREILMYKSSAQGYWISEFLRQN